MFFNTYPIYINWILKIVKCILLISVSFKLNFPLLIFYTIYKKTYNDISVTLRRFFFLVFLGYFSSSCLSSSDIFPHLFFYILFLYLFSSLDNHFVYSFCTYSCNLFFIFIICFCFFYFTLLMVAISR